MFCLVSNPPLVWHLVSRDISTICITFGSDIWYLTTYLIFVCHLVSHYVSTICMASGISLHIQYFVWNLVSHYVSGICMASGISLHIQYLYGIALCIQYSYDLYRALHIRYLTTYPVFVWNLVSHYMSAICMASGMCMVSPYVSSICMTRIGPSLLLPIYVSNFPQYGIWYLTMYLVFTCLVLGPLQYFLSMYLSIQYVLGIYLPYLVA